jgi:hypothetical protein
MQLNLKFEMPAAWRLCRRLGAVIVDIEPGRLWFKLCVTPLMDFGLNFPPLQMPMREHRENCQRISHLLFNSLQPRQRYWTTASVRHIHVTSSKYKRRKQKRHQLCQLHCISSHHYRRLKPIDYHNRRQLR